MGALPGRVNAAAFRKLRNLLLAYASELAAPVLWAGTRMLSGPSSPPHAWRRGLILGHSHLGDVLYRTASLPALRAALPGCEWTYLTSRESAGLLTDNPCVAEVLPHIAGEDSWTLHDGALEALRAKQFDVALCTNTLRHHPDIALALALRIPNRVAFSGKGFTGAVNHPVPLPFPLPYAGYFRAMVSAIVHRPGDWSLRPRIHISEAEQAAAVRLRSALGLAPGRPVLACSLTTRQAHGNWPVDVVLRILQATRVQSDFDVLMCGAADDEPQLRSLASGLPFPVSIAAGMTDVRGFAALLETCSALFTMDSGPRHLGNAMNIPVVFCRNLSHSRIEAGTYCESERDLAPDAEYLSDAEIGPLTRSLPVEPMSRAVAQAVRDGAGRA